MFNIDVSSPPPPRPPRMHSPTPPRTRGDIDAVKQALQLPPSVAAVLASKSPQLNPGKPIDIQKKEAEDDKSSMTESHKCVTFLLPFYLVLCSCPSAVGDLIYQILNLFIGERVLPFHPRLIVNPSRLGRPYLGPHHLSRRSPGRP